MDVAVVYATRELTGGMMFFTLMASGIGIFIVGLGHGDMLTIIGAGIFGGGCDLLLAYLNGEKKEQ